MMGSSCEILFNLIQDYFYGLNFFLRTVNLQKHSILFVTVLIQVL